ncbi:MAG: beta-propeller fold lactonase family protein [Candidatus Korobacteraceae bacterium]
MLSLVLGCGSGSNSTSSLTSIQINPSSAAVRLGSSQQYTATGKFKDGTSGDMTTGVTWGSSQPDAVFINNQNGRNGFATGIGAGTSTITASEGTVQATATLMVSNPMPRFAYVSPAQHGPEIGIYTEGADGSLTPVSGSPILLAGANDMTIDSEGKFLFTTENSDSLQPQVSVNSYAVDHTTGTFSLPPVSTLCCNFGDFNLLLSPSEQTLHVSDSQAISTISVDPTAKLSPVGSTPVIMAPAPGTVANVVTEPGGKFLYAALTFPASVVILAMQSSNGMLTEQGTVPITGPAPDVLVIDPTGQFLYVMHPNNDLQSFLLNGITGELTSIGTTQTRGYPSAGAAHPSGKWVYVGMCCNGSPSVSGFSIDPATGNLTEVTNVATPGGGEPVIVVAEPTGRFLYVEENFGTDVFSIDPKSGALTLVTQQAQLTPSYFTF